MVYINSGKNEDGKITKIFPQTPFLCLILFWLINKREDICGAKDISDNEDELYD
jgi:hypothetical protein